MEKSFMLWGRKWRYSETRQHDGRIYWAIEIRLACGDKHPVINRTSTMSTWFLLDHGKSKKGIGLGLAKVRGKRELIRMEWTPS